jgi:O-antigen/teichoic acid export membrane protein
MVVVLACLRFDQAIPLARDEGRARALLGLALRSALAVSLLVLIVTALLPDGARQGLGIDGIGWLPLLLAGTVLADAATQALSGWAVRRRDLGAVARSRAALGGAQGGAQVALGGAGTGAGGLVVGYLVGRVAALAALLRCRTSVRGDGPGRSDLQATAREAWRYPALLAPAAVLNAAALQLPVVLVAGLYAPAAAGALVLATRVAAAPMQLAGQSIAQAFTGRLGARPDLEHGDLRPAVRDAVVRLGLLGTAVALPIVLAGPSVAVWALGDSWRGAGRCAQLLAPAFALQLVVSPLAAVLAARGRQAAQLAWDAVRLPAIVAAVAVPAALDRSVFVGVGAYGLVLGLSYVALLALIWQAARPSDLSALRSPAAGGSAPA